MSSFLKTFEVAARVGQWPEGQWSLYLRTSLSGAGMTAVSALSEEQQNDHDEELKQTLLSTIMCLQKLIGGRSLNSHDQNNAEAFFRH